jgi:hypothetical protein
MRNHILHLLFLSAGLAIFWPHAHAQNGEVHREQAPDMGLQPDAGVSAACTGSETPPIVSRGFCPGHCDLRWRTLPEVAGQISGVLTVDDLGRVTRAEILESNMTNAHAVMWRAEASHMLFRPARRACLPVEGVFPLVVEYAVD